MRHLNYPPLWTVLHMALAWATARVAAPLGDGWASVGWVVVGLAVALAAWAAATMRRARTTVVPHREATALVTGGPFALVRHPIYLADLLALAGWCLVVGQPLALALAVPLWAVLDRLFVRPEEARLAATFCARFEAWRKRVPRWVPFAPA